MRQQTKAELLAETISLRGLYWTSSSMVQFLARGDRPDAEDSCVMENGDRYTFCLFGVERANGGTLLIGRVCGNDSDMPAFHDPLFDVQMFDDAIRQARAVAIIVIDSYPYRDAIERLRIARDKIFADLTQQTCGETAQGA